MCTHTQGVPVDLDMYVATVPGSYTSTTVDVAVFEGNHFVFDLHLFYYVYLTHYNITMFIIFKTHLPRV